MAWTIYKADGTERLAELSESVQTNAGSYAEPQLEYSGTWMGECFITVNIKSPVPIEFEIGDYIMYRNEKFVINYDPTVIKKARKKMTGDAFCYDNVKFNSLSYELSDVRVLDYVIDGNDIHWNGLPRFSVFCESIEDFADRLQVNADRYCSENDIPDSERWLFITPNSSRVGQRAKSASSRAASIYAKAFENGTYTEDEKVNQNVSIDNMSVWDSMKFIKDTFGLNFIVRDRAVIIGAAGLPTQDVFMYGKGKGLYEIEKVADSEQQIITKLFAYGTDKNLPARYYADLSGSTLPNNLAVNVLMLPGFPTQSLYQWVLAHGGINVDTDKGLAVWKGYAAIFSKNMQQPYVMSVNIEDLGMREASKYFDGSDGEEEIYPTISNTGADTIYSADIIEDNGRFDAGADVANFHIILPDLGFDLRSKLTSESAISMTDGYCGGRDFQIVSATQDSETGMWSCVCQRAHDDALDLWFPYSDSVAHGGTATENEPYQLRAGDKYVLLGIEMPDEYVQAASEKLLEASLKFLSKNDTTRYTYMPKIDEIFMARQNDEVQGTDEVSYHDTIKEGDLMLFSDDDLGIDTGVYIDTLRIKEYGNAQIPTYEVTLRNEKQVGTIQRIQEQLGKVMSGDISAGSMNIPLVKSLINSYGSQVFLSRTRNDSAAGVISFIQGLRIGSDFASGVAGFGGRIDKDANAELESLTLRRFLEVPELRYNRISIQVGNRWRAPGGGIIEQVIPDQDGSGNLLNTGTIILHLEEGEIGKVAVNDICMGIFHDGMTLSNNDADDFDDSKGNFRFSGFFTTYFRVTQIVDTDKHDNSVFYYELRNDQRFPASHHPCDMMHFVAYGNFTDTDRQSSRYSTLTYERYLYHVNNWEFGASNIGAQFGDLSNLSVYGLDMTGYSAYLNNIYMSGRFEQINTIVDELSTYSVDFSDYVDVITVDDVGNVIGGLYKIDEQQHPYDYRIHSAISVRKNSEILVCCSDNEVATAGKYKIYAEPINCTCTLKNSTIYITSITNVKDGVAGSGDDVSFDYDAMRNMNNCCVNLTIDCEGETSIIKQFPVTIKHMSEPFVGADISNKSSGVSWNTKTNAYIGLPITFDFTMWHNNEVLDITSTTNVGLTTTTSGVTLVNGTAPATPAASTIYYTKSIQTITKNAGTANEVSYKVARISITAMGKDVPLVTNIDITCTAQYAGVNYERTLTHTINKSTDANVYSLMPSVDEVIASGSGSSKTISTNKIACTIWCDSSDDKHYTVPVADYARHKLALYYKISYQDGTVGTETAYNTSGDGVSIDTDVKLVDFYIYGINAQGVVDKTVMHDHEDVYVIANGVDGNGAEYIFWTQNSWSGETPSGLGTPEIKDDSLLPAFQTDNYTPLGRSGSSGSWTDYWTDEPSGVAANMKYEFYAQRKKVNGIWQAFGDVHLWNKYVIDGTSGESTYTLDLSNENSFINCDTDGTVIGTYEPTTIMLLHGTQDAYNDFTITVTANNISYTRSQDGKTITPSNITAVNASIVVTATLNTNNSIVLIATYKINKTFAGETGVIYSLVPSLNVIHADCNNVIQDTTLAITVKKTIGSSTIMLDTPALISGEGLHLFYSQGASAGQNEFTSSANNLSTATACGNANYTVIYLRDGEDNLIDRERIPIVSDGEQGDPFTYDDFTQEQLDALKGLNGCIERVYENYIHDSTFYYHNDENDSTITGARYIDFMAVEDSSTASGYRVWMCKVTHPATEATFDDDKREHPTYWEEVSMNVSSAFFTYLIAKNAHFKFGSGNQFVINNSNGNAVAGLTGYIPDASNESQSVRIWAGGSNPYTAPFRVLQSGDFYSEKAHIRGLVEVRDANEGLIVYDSNGNRRVQVVAGEVDEPANSTITEQSTRQAEFHNVDDAFDMTPTAISVSLGELKAGAMFTVSGLSFTISYNTGAVHMKLSSGEKFVVTIILMDTNGNISATLSSTYTATSTVLMDNLSFAFQGISISKTKSYILGIRAKVENISSGSASDTWGGVANSTHITTVADVYATHITPLGTRIGTNGMFVNVGIGKSVSINEDYAEIKYLDQRIKVSNGGVYYYDGSGYVPFIKKTKTITGDYTVLKEDGVLFIDSASDITITLNAASSSRDFTIISKRPSTDYYLTGAQVFRYDGAQYQNNPQRIDGQYPRRFIFDGLSSWYEFNGNN